MSEINEGMIISGSGSVKFEKIDVLAVGSGAKAHKIVNGTGEALPSKDLQEIQKKLEELTSALAAHRIQLENREDVENSVKSVAAELEKEKPNKLTVTSILSGIATAVSSATGIATAAEALKAAVITLL
jgi:hypothetical protein